MEGSIMLSICAMSDLHGYLPEVEPCDLVLICGDIVPLQYQSDIEYTYYWYRDIFRAWVDDLSCNKVLFIAGNHECGFSENIDIFYEMFPENEKATYLQDDLYTYDINNESYRIYGTPWCQEFGKWAFMANDDQLKDIYSSIPENLDILITHDAPYGVSDVLLQKECKWANGEHIGNKPLRQAILEKQPKIVLHGHLHSTSREFENLNTTKVVNCSIKDEFYQPIYKPLYFKINK